MVLAYPKKCVACRLCEAACSFHHEAAFQPSRSRIFVHDLVDPPVYVPVTCFHCSDAPCQKYCPTSAILRDTKTGRIAIEETKCVGCKMCLIACPFGVIGFHEDRKVAQNCDLCGDDPQCVRVCVYGALDYVEAKPTQWMDRLDETERPMDPAEEASPRA